MNSTLLDYTNPNEMEYFDNSSSTISSEYPEIADYFHFMNTARFVVQRIFFPIVYALGIIGNVLSIIVLSQRQMRSSTNNYLTALATFDMLFLILNFSISLKHYPGYKRVIAPWYPTGVLLTDTSSNTSVWLTVSFTVERYIAVCHPMVGKRMCTPFRANIVIIVAFIVCFALTLPVFFEWSVETIQDPNTNISYYEVIHQNIAENPTITKFLYWYSAMIFIIIPLCALSIFNSFLIYSVHKSRSQRQEMTMCKKNTKDPSSQETKITIMLIVVVVVFMLCQLPAAGHLIYSSSFANHDDMSEMNLLRGLGNIFNLLTAINASVNFILYCCLSEKFRQTFIRTLCPCMHKVESPEHSVSNTTYIQMRDPDSGMLKRYLSNNRSRSVSKSPHLHVRDIQEESIRRTSLASSSSCNEKGQNSNAQENHINGTSNEKLSLNATPVSGDSSKGTYATFDQKGSSNSLHEVKKENPVQTYVCKNKKSKIHFVIPEIKLKMLKKKKLEKKNKKSDQKEQIKNDNNCEIEIEEKVTTL